jgi:acyl-coenzyme A thioesterase PaaI-like protein
MTMTPTNEWASAYGALHGGAVGLFIHRAIHYAVSGALPDGDGHVPISFAISYLRPAVCGTEPVECVATITEISRRFAHIDAVMRMADGRVAARVAATHAIIRSEGPEGHVAERLA